MASVWEKFGQLSHLSIAYRSIGRSGARIYGNKQNQVEVVIKVLVLDSSKKPLALSADDLRDKVYLCEYQTGRRLGAPWIVSDKANDYLRPVSSQQSAVFAEEKINDITDVSKYLSCSEGSVEFSFSVGVDIPGVGIFTTSKDGTSTKNGAKGQTGSVFVRPSYLDISTLPAIDYGVPENVIVRGMPKGMDDFEVVAKGMPVIYEGASSSDAGVSSKAKFTIHPRAVGHVFHLGDPIRNEASLSSCKFGGPNPDMIRGTGGNNFDVQFIWVNRPNFGLFNDCSFRARKDLMLGSYFDVKYVVGSDDYRHHWHQKLEYGCITVNICNHRIPEAGLYNHDWSNQGSPIEVKVTDNYGNASVLKIENPNSKDGWPQLYINGKFPA